MTNKAWLIPRGNKEYLCNECKAHRKPEVEWVIHRYGPYIRMNKNGYQLYTHIQCIRLLIDGGWVSYLDLPNGRDYLTNKTSDEKWEELYNATT